MRLELKNLVKIYPYAQIPKLFGRKKAMAMQELQRSKPYTTNEGVIAVRDVNLTIEDGEFLVLLGESGCGKSTLLRMIAGLEDLTLGDVVADGVVINDWLPEDRDMAMIFQNYSLYPHFNVFENIAFPLKNVHMPREQLEEVVLETAKLLGLENQLKKRPSQLSGGQLQRVAIGRAIVRRPKLFLMDEPFSNLDAPMRRALRTEVKKLHKALGTTFVYVTHDQAEAFALGDRIAVMRDGAIEQIGTAQEIYNHPANRYVASFVGQPAMNFVEQVRLRRDHGWSVELFGKQLDLPESVCDRLRPEDAGSTVTVGIRPVNVEIVPEGIPAVVDFCEPLGSEFVVHLRVGDEKMTAVVPEGQMSAPPMRGAALAIRIDPKRFHVFPKE